METELPVIDLTQLHKEVVALGPDAALPCNLSDGWLRHVSYSLDQVLQGGVDKPGYFSAPMVLISNLLLKQGGVKEIEISLDEMEERFRQYRLELALEEVSRVSDIKIVPATLETIFTNRRVEFLCSAQSLKSE